MALIIRAIPAMFQVITTIITAIPVTTRAAAITDPHQDIIATVTMDTFTADTAAANETLNETVQKSDKKRSKKCQKTRFRFIPVGSFLIIEAYKPKSK